MAVRETMMETLSKSFEALLTSKQRIERWIGERAGGRGSPLSYNVPRDPSAATRRTRRWQLFLSGAFLVVLGAAVVSPTFGAVGVLGCMTGVVALGVRDGRSWCDGVCPRGGFLDRYLSRVSRRVDAPKWLARPAVRAGVATVVFAVMAVGLARQWGDPVGMAGVVARLLLVSTVAAVLLGVVYHERAWCLVCPAGTFARVANAVGERLGIDRPTVTVDPEACIDCGQCGAACRPQLDPSAASGEAVTDGGTATLDDGDCFRCGYCVETCPTDALEMDGDAR